MRFETSYISSNCNEIPKIADWGKNNLICYGSCDSVMVYDPKYCGGGKVTRNLVGHLKRVNTVKWLSGNDVDKETEIVSGSTDHTVVVWTLEESDFKSVTLEGHTSNVNIVDGYYKENEKRYAVVVSVGMDNTVRVWIRILSEGNFTLHQTINLGDHLAVGLKLLFLPNFNQFLLACGLDNSKILLYTEHEQNPVKFVEATQLMGHEDWVRGLDFKKDGDDYLLASCSQDTFIRIWRISTTAAAKEGHFSSLAKPCLSIKSKQFYVYLESVLTGHEGWIYSVRWSPKNLQLLSASIDKSMILWQRDETTGMWIEKMRLGVVGGNIMGFYGGLFSAKGNQILGHSYHGAFHIWRKAPESNEWTPCTTIGGHSAEVVDCAWEPEGEFLFTCGADQTTRIHAPWSSNENEVTWHEIARPQIHGYDISSIAVISRYKYASAAEEKVIRVFEAPINFVENFRRLCHIEADPEGDLVVRSQEQLPQGASVPSLGLSNKAVYGHDNSELALAAGPSSMYPEESHFQATFLTEPPTEETLLQNTLWPEVQKLYGHGYEVYSLAASPDQKFLASACKSTQLEHANILLWDVPSWKIVQTLPSHTLTVVQLQFSPDSNHLLSVSRDRRWTLFSKNENGNFEQAATTDKNTGVHNRIIWTCSWTHDSKFFVTGSRDGKVVVWAINADIPPSPILGKCQRISETLEYPNDSVTAVAFAPILVEDGYMLAVGLESGTIHVFLWRLKEWKKVLFLCKGIAHHQAVKKLAFRPVVGKAGIKVCNKNVLQLATGSADNSVKIFDIYV